MKVLLSLNVKEKREVRGCMASGITMKCCHSVQEAGDMIRGIFRQKWHEME